MAPKNPKIYAELLFYKTMKEAYDIEYNYEDHDTGGNKNAWSEEDETELRILFEENQKNPESDQGRNFSLKFKFIQKFYYIFIFRCY